MTRLNWLVFGLLLGWGGIASAQTVIYSYPSVSASVPYTSYYSSSAISTPVVTASPTVSGYTSYYAPSTTSYYTPSTTSYYAPSTTSYYTPSTTSYYAPSASASTTAYYAPATTAYYPSTTAYYAPSVGTSASVYPYLAGYSGPVYANATASPYTSLYAPGVASPYSSYYWGAGPLGRPEAYVPGQPVRNVLRWALP